MAQYLGAASSSNACWTLVGIGLRLSQDVGAHRRTPRNHLPAEDELWKRAFWYGCPPLTGILLTIFLGCYWFWTACAVLPWAVHVRSMEKSWCICFFRRSHLITFQL